MSLRFVNCDRNTPMLLPPDLRDWVAEDDLAHFIVEAVEGMDMRCAAVNHRGSGSEQYPPAILLAVLIYCYATGRFSSRDIERATYRDLSVRYLAANTHPDHDTLCKFRRENRVLVEAAFLEVLRLGAEMGLGRLGRICVDGTKMRANASMERTRRLSDAEAQLQDLQREVRECLAAAESADKNQSEDGTGLGERLRDRQRRSQQLAAARDRLRERHKAEAAKRELERANRGPGEPPRALPPEPPGSTPINLSDPESSKQREPRGGGFLQGYNAQLAVSAEPGGGLIVGASVCSDASDRRQLEPVIQGVPRELVPVKEIIADTGYDNLRQILSVEGQTGATVWCPPQQDASRKPGRPAPRRRQRETRVLREQRRKSMESVRGREMQALRHESIEPVFGIIKGALGFRGFLLRGLEKVNLEWKLVALAFNCRRLALRRALAN